MYPNYNNPQWSYEVHQQPNSFINQSVQPPWNAHPPAWPAQMSNTYHVPYSYPSMYPQANGPFGYPHQKTLRPSAWKAAFTNEQGSFDVNKTFGTVDQMMKTVNQMSPLVKTLGAFILKR
ncbi:YppG family protein [Halalkalibacterium ligniniphilum]|uniref:YppG family protein n=1 Tax=Halalkalibacterium ligniniphilum TaxID=1134413 RepID=UPI000349196C|nr:YppG family protein [Halalkalibacterium ligniniphilum]